MKAQVPDEIFVPLAQMGSIAAVMRELADFRKNHPAPLPPDKPMPRQKRKKR